MLPETEKYLTATQHDTLRTGLQNDFNRPPISFIAKVSCPLLNYATT